MNILHDRIGTLAETYGLEATPTNYFIDSDGMIRLRVSGVLTFADIEKKLDEMRYLQRKGGMERNYHEYSLA